MKAIPLQVSQVSTSFLNQHLNMKQYLVKDFHPESKKYYNIRCAFNEKGWSCFPFLVEQVDTDPQGKPICKIPDAPGCGIGSLFFFVYEEV